MNGSSQTTASSPGRIYLLRHGAVRSVQAGKRYTGAQDIALSDIGLAQARAWAEYFAGAGLQGVFSSDLVRCLETARIIGSRCTLTPKVLPEFREVCLGAWEGQRFETVARSDPQAYQQRGDHIADHRPPGGESFRDLLGRVWPVFEGVSRRSCGPVLIVTHAGVIRVLLCRLLGMPLQNLFYIGQSYAGLSIVAARPEGYRVQAVNTPPPS